MSTTVFLINNKEVSLDIFEDELSDVIDYELKESGEWYDWLNKNISDSDFESIKDDKYNYIMHELREIHKYTSINVFEIKEIA